MLVHLRHAPELDHDEGRTRARIAGEEACGLYPGEPWGAVESHRAVGWRAVRGSSPLTWADGREDAHAAWQVATLERGGHLRDDAPVIEAA